MTAGKQRRVLQQIEFQVLLTLQSCFFVHPSSNKPPSREVLSAHGRRIGGSRASARRDRPAPSSRHDAGTADGGLGWYEQSATANDVLHRLGDVGGWNCEKNAKSRDALAILDADLNLIGKPWRGNLSREINASTDSADWVNRLFDLCKTAPPSRLRVILAIDTPLGFSDDFIHLVTRKNHAGAIGESQKNSYLFRQTERFLFKRGLKPLSPVKDMIGSQATKGMHVLAKFAPKVEGCGVWAGAAGLTVIEAYPSGCKGSATVKDLQQLYGLLGHDDLEDALTCALLAYLFAVRPDTLVAPPESVPVSEGWIWVPKDGLPMTIESTGTTEK